MVTNQTVARAPVAPATEQPVVAAPREPVRSVDILERDPSLRDSLAAIATRLGCQTRAFASAEEYQAAAPTPAPGCLLIDLPLAGGADLGVIRALRGRGQRTPFAVVTGSAGVPETVQLMQSGAIAVLEKPFAIDRLEAALERAFEIERRRAEFDERFSALSGHVAQLSEREHRVLREIAAGQLNKVIAATLEVSVRTVESDRARVVEKLGAQTTGEAVAKYAEYRVMSDLVYNDGTSATQV